MQLIVRTLAMTCIVAVAILLTMSQRASAQNCFFGVSDVAFGTIDTSTNANFDTTANMSILCFGGSGGQTVRICPSFGAGTGGVAAGGDPRRMLSGANQLNYNLYQNAARTQVWGSQLWGQPPTPPTIDVALNGFGFAFASRTIYARVPSGQTGASAGVFNSAFSGGEVSIAFSTPSAGNCAAIGTTNARTTTFNVTATNTPTCSVSASTLDFGAHGMLTGNVDATNTLSITCTSGTSYTVGLNGGNSAAVDPTQRRMSLGANDVIYGLYRNSARSQPWGNTIGSNTVAGTGSGGTQSLTVYGRVPPQLTPPAGTYTDVIVVTVTY